MPDNKTAIESKIKYIDLMPQHALTLTEVYGQADALLDLIAAHESSDPSDPITSLNVDWMRQYVVQLQEVGDRAASTPAEAVAVMELPLLGYVKDAIWMTDTDEWHDGLDADEINPDMGYNFHIGEQVRTKECSLGYADTWTPSPDGPVRGCKYVTCTIIDLLGESKAKVLVLDGEWVGAVHDAHYEYLSPDQTAPNSSTVG